MSGCVNHEATALIGAESDVAYGSERRACAAHLSESHMAAGFGHAGGREGIHAFLGEPTLDAVG